MPGFGDTALSEGITPGRRTRVRFDVADHVPVEPAWAVTRARENIHRASYAGIGSTSRILRLASGYLGLEPLADEPSQMHELTGGQAPIIDLSQWNVAPSVVQAPIFKRPDNATMPGVLTGSAADLQASGDSFLTVRRPAGSSWDTPYSIDPLPAPEPPAPLALHAPNILVDFMAETVATELADQGYLLRWRVPGTELAASDRLFYFMFGGALTAAGHGRFCLVFAANGYVALNELVNSTWVKRDEWQYAAKKDVHNQAHSMRIIPHARRYIEFAASAQEVLTPALYGQWTGGQLGPPRMPAQAHVYEVPEAVMALKSGESDTNANGQFVTGPGSLQWHLRRDLRSWFQVTRLTYPFSGKLVDLPTQFPFGSGADVAHQIIWHAPSAGIGGTPILQFSLYDAQTAAVLPYGTPNGWQLPGDENLLVAVFDFTSSGNGSWSPWLLAYQLRKPAVVATMTPGEFEDDGVDALSVYGQGAEPDTERAEIVLKDERDLLDRLRVRGRMAVQVVTDLDGGPEETVLFRGYLARSPARPRGRAGEWAPGQTLAYTERHDYDLDVQGQWARLAEAPSPGTHLYLTSPDIYTGFDPEGTRLPSGAILGPKVTDQVRELLRAAGYPDTMIDIPDSDVRLVLRAGEGDQNHVIPPFTPLFPKIREYLRNYLGAVLFFDANAGTQGGMWRARVATLAEAPLFTFRTETPATPAPALVHHPGFWGEEETFILKDTYQSYPIPPEASMVWVTTMGEYLPDKGSQVSFSRWLVNPRAVDLPYFTSVADPNSPDYFGRAHLITHYDPDLKTQEAVDRVAQRLYLATCFGRKGATFTAPFHPVADAADTQLMGRRRPLRYGDTVAIDENRVLVTSCTLHWEGTGRDAVQVQVLEIEEPIVVP